MPVAPKTKRNNQIKQRRAKGWSYGDLSKRYNLNVKTVFELVNGYYPKKDIHRFVEKISNNT